MTVQLAVEPVARNEAGLAAALPILAERFGERCGRSDALRQQHGHTTTWLTTQAPDAVIFPESTGEVVEIVRVCREHRVPVIPFGVGTSLEGHVNAPGGGISIDFARMNRVLSVHAEDLDCVVQPGVTRKQLNAELAPQGVRVNAVLPGWVETSMAEERMREIAAASGKGYEETRRELLAGVPLQRISEPEEIAGLVAFLASDDGVGFTGQGFDPNNGAWMG